jgi:hypothetical protein
MILAQAFVVWLGGPQAGPIRRRECGLYHESVDAAVIGLFACLYAADGARHGQVVHGPADRALGRLSSRLPRAGFDLLPALAIRIARGRGKTKGLNMDHETAAALHCSSFAGFRSDISKQLTVSFWFLLTTLT